MTQFAVHSPENAPGKSQDVLQQAKKHYGFIPNLLGVMSEAPAAAEGYLALSKLVMETSFSPTERHVVWFENNFLNNCTYCMAAHTAIAHSEDIDQDVIDAARLGEPYSDSRLETLRQFTRKVVEQRGWVDGTETEKFLEAGFTKQHVLEIVLIAAHKVLSNYTNHFAETPSDPPFAKFAWEKPVAV